ncbi:cytochrome P450 [Calocera viscosa TUFC12733]|uniref:Cytochrome P450 n=1 Tax=Calocera viscosa (strain TUFC12733) TaxID=1330018 RepID=A0A167PYW5_CALVF|nr:cytochrome P450 [Calocera viscosa TUFC12733]
MAAWPLAALHDPMHLSVSTLAIGLAIVATYGLYLVAKFLHGVLSTPVRQLRGPPNPSWILGQEPAIIAAEDGILIQQWAETFGFTFKYPSFMSKWELCTMDPRAVSYILTNNYVYPKPDVIRQFLSQILGTEGLISAEGETHKRQRRILNPSFSPAQLREITPVFFEKATELRYIWQAQISASPTPTVGTTIDVYQWLSRATLDIIGLAGFGYDFECLIHDKNELAVAFRELFRVQLAVRWLNLVRMWFPVLRPFLPEPDRQLKKISSETMRRVGMDLIQRKKAEVAKSMIGEKPSSSTIVVGRDILSALIRANMASDVFPMHKLTDEEVLSQITTFILAGHETTSNSVTWSLLTLAQHSSIQDKLRDELLAVPEEMPSMDDLNGLPYLDLCTRELLRLQGPVRETVRTALHDDTIPLQYPIVDKYGNTIDSVRVKAGDSIIIPIMAIDRSERFWGPTAHEFIPERFRDLPKEASAIPGGYSHMMTFLGGQRACIGYRFSIIEMKALLFVLLRSFIFELSNNNMEILKKTAVVTRPLVKGEEDKGAQLPLLIRAVTM